MQLETKDGWVIQTSSVSECLDLIHERLPFTSPNEDANDEVRDAAVPGSWRADWTGVDVPDLMSARDWKSGRDLLAKYEVQLASLPKVDSVVRRRRWADDGDEFSRDRFDAGYLECWQTRKRTTAQKEGGVIKITVNIGGASTVRAEDLAWIGAAACVLVDRLEDAGYRVEVEVQASVRGMMNVKRENHLTILPVKAANDPLDVDTLLMACSAPWFFRVHLFRLWASMPHKLTSGKGYHMDAPEWSRGEIHLEAVYSLSEAQAQLSAIIAKFNTNEGEQ